jgi:hypothetical protein
MSRLLSPALWELEISETKAFYESSTSRNTVPPQIVVDDKSVLSCSFPCILFTNRGLFLPSFCSEIESTRTIADETASTEAPLGLDKPNTVWLAGCRFHLPLARRGFAVFASLAAVWKCKYLNKSTITDDEDEPEEISLEEAFSIARDWDHDVLFVLDGSGQVIEEYPLRGEAC